ncbi:hypothetical protein ACH5RR_023098 [Cinchona calisaya]|uniref:Uncharacterized protein n=1 Tax=Cinchona calisaya TaxID=153742 RepID=A0ABD2Z9P5_9GENT
MKYTNEEMLQLRFATADEDMKLTSTNIVTSDTEALKTDKEMQLFTPTTKQVLEEIAGSSDTVLKPNSTVAGVKKNLNFTATIPCEETAEFATSTETYHCKHHGQVGCSESSC